MYVQVGRGRDCKQAALFRLLPSVHAPHRALGRMRSKACVCKDTTNDRRGQSKARTGSGSLYTELNQPRVCQHARNLLRSAQASPGRGWSVRRRDMVAHRWRTGGGACSWAPGGRVDGKVHGGIRLRAGQVLLQYAFAAAEAKHLRACKAATSLRSATIIRRAPPPVRRQQAVTAAHGRAALHHNHRHIPAVPVAPPPARLPQ